MSKTAMKFSVVVISFALAITVAGYSLGVVGISMRVDAGSAGPSGGFAAERLDQADIVVIGRATGSRLIGFRRTSPLPWSYAVQLSEVRLSVDCVISGKIAKGETRFYQYEWVDSGSGPSTNVVSPGLYSVFLLKREWGRLRAVVDVFPSAIPLPFFPGRCPDPRNRARRELVSELLFKIAPETDLRSEYDLWDTEHTSSVLVGDEATRRAMEALLAHPSVTVRDAAAKTIRRIPD